MGRASFERLVSRLKALGFKVDVEEGEWGELRCREARGSREVGGRMVLARVEEVEGEVTALSLDVPDLQLHLDADRHAVDEVDRLYRRALEVIEEVDEGRGRVASIVDELRGMGFEVHEAPTYVEASYHDGALNYIRLVLRLAREGYGDGLIIVQRGVDYDNVLDVVRRAMEVVRCS